jgi:tetratricopeptide (TPR) repeat protein
LRRGNLSQAIPALERGLGISRELGLPTYAHWIAPSLGLAYALTGRADEAMALLEQTIEYGAAVHLVSQHSLTMVYLGEALFLAGRDGDALERAAEALELSRDATSSATRLGRCGYWVRS